MYQNENRTITFMLGGMIFEYDEEKNVKNIKNMEFHSKVPLVYFLITIELSFLMKKIASRRNDLTQ